MGERGANQDYESAVLPVQTVILNEPVLLFGE
jgi:hypothetical protein